VAAAGYWQATTTTTIFFGATVTDVLPEQGGFHEIAVTV
jgi:hypothetical protein